MMNKSNLINQTSKGLKFAEYKNENSSENENSENNNTEINKSNEINEIYSKNKRVIKHNFY